MPSLGRQYDTVEDAAAAAIMWLSRQPRAMQQEYMGLLIRDPRTSKFMRTEFQTLGKRNRSEWRGFPDGEIAGSVHNHPVPRAGEDPSTDVSQTDILGAAQLDVPGFLAAMVDGGEALNRKFDPAGNPAAVRSARMAQRRRRNSTRAETDPFLAQFPIEEYKQAVAQGLLGRDKLRREQPSKPPIPKGLLAPLPWEK